MRIDAVVVRLTPEEEQKRREDLAVAMAKRDQRIREQNLQRFKLVSEQVGEETAAEDATRMIMRSELEAQAKKGALAWLGEKLVLCWNRIAAKAYRFIHALKAFLPWNLVKRFAINSGLAACLVFGGSLSGECVKSDGTTRWSDTMNVNGITTQGLNYILDAGFHNGTAVTTWYMGLVQGSSTPTYSAADVMNSHAGWTEYTAYSQTLRVTWDEGAAASGSVTNSTTMDYSMNATGTVAGGFLTSGSAKSGTTGTLWMTASFSGGNQAVGNGDTLKLTYTLNTTVS